MRIFHIRKVKKTRAWELVEVSPEDGDTIEATLMQSTVRAACCAHFAYMVVGNSVQAFGLTVDEE